MIYIFFFLLGIPLWLVACSRLLRNDAIRAVSNSNRNSNGFGNLPWRNLVWAGAAFLAPLALLGLSGIAQVLMAQQMGEPASWMRGVGYFLVVVNLLAFFSPFVVVFAFESRNRAQSDGLTRV